MHVILGYNQLLAENTDDPGIRGFIDSIEKAGNVLLNLINDILDISRIESGKLRFEYGEVDLRRLLGDVGQIFNAAIRGKGLEYIEEISVNLPNRVSLDEDRVRQMLLNLVGNAVKFTEEGFVKVRAESSPLPAGSRRTDLLFVVEDSGIGIRQDQQQRVFEAFQQQEGQSSRKFGGTGLGLAITKRLVEAMNGEISVHSRRGTGTVFRVLLKDVEILEKTGSGKLPGQVLSESGVSSEKGESTSMHQLEMYEPEDYIMDGDQLLESLKTDFYPRWEQLRRRMFLDELQGFADSLERLGHTHNAVFLIRYSKKLQQAAQQVDIPELELLIQDYPRILKGAGYRLPESHE